MMILAEVAWYETAGGIIALITGLIGLVGTGISAYFAIKTLIEKNKGKSVSEIWTLIVTMADSAMKAAEASDKKGADKKTMVMDTIKASALVAGLDITAFLDQLSAYIDQTIDFVNDMTKK